MKTKFYWRENMESTQKKSFIPPCRQAYSAKQLNLFQDFLCNTPHEKQRLSNTIELWDAVPKYFINKRRQGQLRKDGYLPTAERTFQFRGKEVTVKIRPARITVDNKDKEFYPAAREELVEDTLRKLACQSGDGYLEDKRSGVRFTLHQLRNELKNNGHTLSYYEVMEALRILVAATIEISSVDGTTDYTTAPLTTLIRVSKNDIKENPGSRWYADFSSLVTEGIQLIQYRQYDYTLNMVLKSQLARYIHKRMCHNYVQASLLHTYNITMSGVARDSGLLECKRSKDNRKMLENALDELRSNNIILYYQGSELRGKRNALNDVRYKITPHHDFIAQVKRANKRLKTNLTFPPLEASGPKKQRYERR